jgi:5-methylcytosine-specific restriction protein A
MAIPHNLSRDHIIQAIQYLKQHGLPHNAESTKYDVIDSDGHAWPPKAVMERAVELATGTPFPRTEFSGGDQTNRRLQALGFEIRIKAGTHTSDLAIENLTSGMILSNDDIVQVFTVGNAGGMRWSSVLNALVIIADHTKSLYDDRWDDNLLFYTGMGRIGDQQLTGQNLRLARQPEIGIVVHLFEVFEQNKYLYAGQVALTGEVTTEPQPDDEGNQRQVYVFPLRLVTAAQPPKPTAEQVRDIKRKRQQQLKAKSLDQLRALAEAGGKQNPSRRAVLSSQYDRDEAVAEYVKRAARGICGLCEQPAPFSTSEGPYLESHHVVHLAQGGGDKISNAVALCANCHRKMHVLNRASDRKLLLERIAMRESFQNA